MRSYNRLSGDYIEPGSLIRRDAPAPELAMRHQGKFKKLLFKVAGGILGTLLVLRLGVYFYKKKT